MEKRKKNKKYFDPVDDPYYARNEFFKITQKYERDLQEKIIQILVHTYQNSTLEIERRRLIERGDLHSLRIDYYLKSVLIFSLNKLHKGDQLKAYELLEEIKQEVFRLKSGDTVGLT